MPSEDISFEGVHGGRLSGVLDLPAGRAMSWAVFAHCFTCSKDSHAASRISRALAVRGIGVLRYDFTGLGESGGDFADATFTSDVANLVAAADVLRGQDRAPGLLVGHSLGGAAVVAAAGRIPEVVAVATINAPAHPSHVSHAFSEVEEELAAEGQARVRLGGRSFTVRQALLEDLSGQAQADRIRSLDAALLVLHAPADEVVDIDNARELFQLARHPKSFVALDGGDHLLSRRVDSLYAADVTAAWASRYLAVDPAQEDPEPSGRPERRQLGERRRRSDRRQQPGSGERRHEPEEQPGSGERRHEPQEQQDQTPTEAGVVVVREIGEAPFTQQVRAGRHTWVVDEPPKIPGGTDAGPTPYDHLLAGLGACTAMTLRMYATRKDIPLERVTVTLRQQNAHADDLAACVEGREGCVRQFVREVRLEGDLTDSQRERLLLVADKCPVHRTLEAGVEVVTELVT